MRDNPSDNAPKTENRDAIFSINNQTRDDETRVVKSELDRTITLLTVNKIIIWHE